MINWKEWWKAALIRAVRTFAEVALGYISGAALISDIDWVLCLSASSVGALVSVLLALTGLPEVPRIEGGDEQDG